MQTAEPFHFTEDALFLVMSLSIFIKLIERIRFCVHAFLSVRTHFVVSEVYTKYSKSIVIIKYINRNYIKSVLSIIYYVQYINNMVRILLECFHVKYYGNDDSYRIKYYIKE